MFQGNTQNHESVLVAAGLSLRRTGETPVPPTTFKAVEKGEEVGYVQSGRLPLRVGKGVYNLKTGEVIYLTSEIPGEWRNPCPSVARLLWVKVK